jgi:hypothetical protein
MLLFICVFEIVFKERVQHQGSQALATPREAKNAGPVLKTVDN